MTEEQQGCRFCTLIGWQCDRPVEDDDECAHFRCRQTDCMLLPTKAAATCPIWSGAEKLKQRLADDPSAGGAYAPRDTWASKGMWAAVHGTLKQMGRDSK